MDEIMKEFQQSIFYRELFNNRDIILIYIGGSRCTQLQDEKSDYDLIVVTKNGVYEDAHKYVYLLYKNNTKIHWYYTPIKYLFRENCVSNITGVQIRNLRENIILYKNPKYLSMIDALIENKNNLSNIHCYTYFNNNKDYIKSIIDQNHVSEKSYTKNLYHICLASYYVKNETPDQEDPDDKGVDKKGNTSSTESAGHGSNTADFAVYQQDEDITSLPDDDDVLTNKETCPALTVPTNTKNTTKNLKIVF